MPSAKKDQKKKKRDNDSSDPPRKKRKPNPKKKSKPKKVVNNLPIYSPAKAIVLILGDKIQVGTDSQDLPLTSRIFFFEISLGIISLDFMSSMRNGNT
eukprot:UN26178